MKVQNRIALIRHLVFLLTISSALLIRVSDAVAQPIDSIKFFLQKNLDEANQLYIGNQFDSAFSRYTMIKMLTEQQNDFIRSRPDLARFEPEAYLGLANCYFKKSDYTKAIPLLRYGLEKAKNIQETGLIARMLHRLGACYMVRGEIDLALNFYQKSAFIQQTLGDSLELSKTLNNIGLAFFNQKEYEKALSYFRQAYKLKLTSDAEAELGTVLNNIGMVYVRTRQLDSAKFYLDKSLLTRIRFKQDFDIAKSYASIGEMHMAEASNQLAMKFYKQSEEIFKSMGIEYELANLYKLMAECSQGMGMFNESDFYARESQKLALQINIADEQVSVLKIMADNFAKRGDYKNAYLLSKEFGQARDSSQRKISTLRLLELDIMYQTELKDHQIQIQEAQIALQESKARQNKNLRKLYSVMGILLSIAIGFILFANRNKLRTEKRLTQRKQMINGQRRQIERQMEDIKRSSKETQARNEEIEAQKELQQMQVSKIEQQTAILSAQRTELLEGITYAQHIQKALISPFNNESHPRINDFLYFHSGDLIQTSFIKKFTRTHQQLYIIVESRLTGTSGALASLMGYIHLRSWVEGMDQWRATRIQRHINEQLEISFENNNHGSHNLHISVFLINPHTGHIEHSGDHALWLADSLHVEQISDGDHMQLTQIRTIQSCYILSDSLKESLKPEQTTTMLQSIVDKPAELQNQLMAKYLKINAYKRDVFVMGIKPTN